MRGCAESVVAIVGLWLDEDHAGGEHKRGNLPPDLSTVLEYLVKVPPPLEPSLILDSGGGAHAWLLFREPFLIESDEDRARAASLARRYQTLVRTRVAPEYAHDATADLARVLRTAGTVNTKYGTLARVVHPAPNPDDVRRVDVSEIEEVLDQLDVPDDGPPSKPEAQPQPELTIGTKLSSRVQALLDGTPRIQNLFLGKGKVELGPDGTEQDTSSSGYDFSIVMRLARNGVTDPSELATALWHRPDGAAQAKGLGYVERTVQRALERVAAIETQRAEQTQAMLDFQVERVRVFDSDPAEYEVTVEGSQLRFTTAQLLSPSKFKSVFTDALKRVPTIPGKNEDWTPIVNGWLAEAERVDMPPEASDEPALREAVTRAVHDLPIGDETDDLDHGKAVELQDGSRAFKADTLLRTLKEDRPGLTRHKLCRVLRDLGYESEARRIGGNQVRVWADLPNAPHTRARES